MGNEGGCVSFLLLWRKREIVGFMTATEVE